MIHQFVFLHIHILSLSLSLSLSLFLSLSLLALHNASQHPHHKSWERKTHNTLLMGNQSLFSVLQTYVFLGGVAMHIKIMFHI